jgi:uncharacterized protein YijF (DUF1287 family)
MIDRLLFLLIGICAVAPAHAGVFEQELVDAAIARTNHRVTYDGSYVSIHYPGGDVPADTGVCTDVVIRTYRVLGSDLQRLVHEDISKNFGVYPSRHIWGLERPDRNIDHRRVPNLQTFFKRHGSVLPITDNPQDYSPGDLVTWMLPGNLPHIGIVTDRKRTGSKNPMIVHNIGLGPKLEDMLFDYPITGHFRYTPDTYKNRN